MVEFGLKLEDNKVSEWSDKYIDYEDLKKILQKASAAVKKKDELCKRKPELAEEIIAAYNKGQGPNQMTPSSSQHDLVGSIVGHVGLSIQEEGGQEQAVVDQVPPKTASESKPLLSKDEKHESHGTIASATDSLSNHISRTLSGHFSGYFSNSKYEQRIRESLKEIENLEERFDESIHQQVRCDWYTCLHMRERVNHSHMSSHSPHSATESE